MSRWRLPEKWQWARAGAIAEIVGGGTPSTKNPANFTDNGIPWLTPADLSDYQEVYIGRGKRDLSREGYESCGAQLMPPDSVLFTSRAPIGYCVLAANDICTNQGFKSLVLRGNIDPKFVRYYLLASKDYAESAASGSTFKELSGKRMADLEIPIPPLNEQKRIAARIEELQSHSRRTREALEAIPDLLEQLRESILSAAFRGDLTREWREKNLDVEPASELLKRIRAERRKRWEAAELEKLKAKGLSGEKLDAVFARRRKRYREPEPADTTNLPELHESWCWANWDQLSDWVTYGFTRPMPHVSEGPAIITAKNVAFGRIDFTSAAHTGVKEFNALSPKDRPVPGDILVTKDGTIGRAAIVREHVPPFCINQSVAVIWLRSCTADRSYLLRTIEAPSTQRRMEEYARGMAMQHLSIIDFAKIPLPLAPIEEQKEIANILETSLSQIEKTRDDVEKKTGLLDRLEQSILASAFRGELVTQNPSDEPASTLLERIREEKARETTDQKTRGKQRGREMKRKKDTQREVLTVLREASRAMKPEDVFSACGFDEESVDAFYEQVRNAVVTKQIREIRKGDLVRLEAMRP